MQAVGGRIRAHPNGAFFVLTFLISWTLMAPAAVAGELTGPAVALFFLGVFGPAIAAAVVTHVSGRSVRAWLREIVRFRVRPRFYLAAIGFPVALALTASAGFVLAGEELDSGLAGERLAAFVPVFVYCLLLNGGPEEFGWRGFALPGLERRFSPVRATVILGLLWGLWHLPLLRVEENAGHDLAALPLAAILVWTLGGFVAYAFTYTYAWNRTRSVVICMVLHAGFNTANGLLILRPDDELTGTTYVVLSLILTGLLWLTAIGLIVATKGRLGRPDEDSGGAVSASTHRAPTRGRPAVSQEVAR